MGGTVNRYSKEEWVDLMVNLKGLPNFRHRVRSSPLDEEKNVYVIYVNSVLYNSTVLINEICVIITADRVHVEVVLKEKEESEPVKLMKKVLYEEELDDMPMYINSKDEIARKIAIWRLGVGK